jgi:hypothetical protein
MASFIRQSDIVNDAAGITEHIVLPRLHLREAEAEALHQLDEFGFGDRRVRRGLLVDS